LLGLSMGINAKDLAIDELRVDASKILEIKWKIFCKK
jgi:hypothetical protein